MPSQILRSMSVPMPQRKWLLRGEKAFGKVNEFLEANEKKGHLRARAIWVLAQLGKRGRAKVAEYLTAEDDAEKPLVAYRALRHADPSGTLDRSKTWQSQNSYPSAGKLPSA